MTATSTVRFQVVDTGARRLVTVSPAGRPGPGGPQAHPSRAISPGRVGAVASCRVSRPAPVSRLLAVKVAAVGLLAAVGVAVTASQFVGVSQPDPAVQYVAGDPAWAHVSQP